MTMSGGSLCAGTCRLTNGRSLSAAGQHGLRGDPPAPALGAERVAELPQVGAGHERREQLEQPTAAGRRRAGRAEMAVECPVQREGEVDDEQENARRPAQVRAGGPLPRGREPDHARDRDPGDAEDEVVLGHPDQLQYPRHQRGQHRGAEHGQEEAAGGGPRPGGAVRLRTGVSRPIVHSGAATRPAIRSAPNIAVICPGSRQLSAIRVVRPAGPGGEHAPDMLAHQDAVVYRRHSGQ